MYSKDFLESLVVDNKESAFESIQSGLSDKISDALEVRRVEIASALLSGADLVEEEVDIQSLQENANARELVLHADNDEQLYRSSHLPIMANLKKKVAKGVYDHEKATKLWGYHADRAAQSYHKAHGSSNQKWHQMFSTADRKAAAKQFADQAHDELHEETISEVFGALRGAGQVAPRIIKSAGEMERDAVNRYAKGNKAIRNRDGLKSEMGKARKNMQKFVPPRDEVEHMQNIQARVRKVADRTGQKEQDIWKRLQSEELDLQIWEEVLNEVSAPGQEEWIKANKKRFIERYGEEKGKRILYAKAWKMAKEEVSLDEVAEGGGITSAQLNRNVLSNLRRATQTLGLKGINPAMAASAHRDYSKLVAKNPKAPGYMLLRKLSSNKAQQVQSLSQAGVPLGQSLEANPADFNQALQRIKRFK